MPKIDKMKYVLTNTPIIHHSCIRGPCWKCITNVCYLYLHSSEDCHVDIDKHWLTYACAFMAFLSALHGSKVRHGQLNKQVLRACWWGFITTVASSCPGGGKFLDPSFSQIFTIIMLHGRQWVNLPNWPFGGCTHGYLCFIILVFINKLSFVL